MTPAAVVVDDLTMTYGAKTAVDHLSLTVEAGQVTAVLGPNGAGKTTTLETCEGYHRAQSGRVSVLGLDPVRDRDRLASRVGVMLQSGGAWSGSRAVEMLRYVASLYADPLPVEPLVERLGLASCGRTPYRRLSGGQQQRLALATAIVGRPELVFLDEPTAGLDPQARRTTWEVVRDLTNHGVTVVLSTHYMEEAEQLADHVHVLDRGTVVASGTPAELTASTPRLVLESANGPDATTVQALAGPGCEVRATAPGAYEIAGHVTPQTLAAVSAWFAERSLMPDRLVLDRRSLEDVFLDLTGKDLRA